MCCSAGKMSALLVLIAVNLTFVHVQCLTDELRFISRNVTELLNQMLSPRTYNKNVRPNIRGAPVVVSVNMYIKSIGPISENENEYTMDLYFRQSWRDARLKFNLDKIKEMSMSYLFVDKVWKPDTYFINGKKSSLHKITSANKFMRLRSNGFLTLSMRLTVSASCKMHLKKFPLDSQNCSILIGSYAYRKSDLIYKWASEGAPVATEPGLELAQYNLIGSKTIKSLIVERGDDEYYMIQANFVFQRSIGFFMLQVYAPCCLIICCSWVSFWINPDDVPARIQLGVIPVLSITTIGFGNRSALPKVSHATALDWFLILCFAFAFGVILEYAYINFINKIYSDGKQIYEAKKLLTKVVETITQCSHSNIADGSDEAYGIVADGEKTDEDKKKEGREKEGGGGIGEKKSKLKSSLTFIDAEVTIEIESKPEVEKGCFSPTLFMSSQPHQIQIPEEKGGEVVVGRSKGQSTRRGKPQTLQTIAELRSEEAETEVQVPTSMLPEVTNAKKLANLILVPFRAPLKFWRRLSILPDEKAIIKRIEDENPQKFPSIDIRSRVVFPTSFILAVNIYFISYFYIIPDDSVDVSEL